MLRRFELLADKLTHHVSAGGCPSAFGFDAATTLAAKMAALPIENLQKLP